MYYVGDVSTHFQVSGNDYQEMEIVYIGRRRLNPQELKKIDEPEIRKPIFGTNV